MVKKSYWVLGLVFLFIFSGSFISEAAEINEYEDDQLSEFDETGGVGALITQCSVSDSCGGVGVGTVSQSDGSENMYWMNHVDVSGKFVRVDFILTFRTDSPKSSPLRKQTQTFKLGTGVGTVCTPFGVTSWGGDPIFGPARLTVKAYTKSGVIKKCTYDFAVGP
jgi:hypothetical protein